MKDIETFAAKVEKFTLMLSAEERRRTTKIPVRASGSWSGSAPSPPVTGSRRALRH